VLEKRAGTSRTQKLLDCHDVSPVFSKVKLDLLHAPPVAGFDAQLRVPVECAGRLDAKTSDTPVWNRSVGDALASETLDIDENASEACEDEPGKTKNAGLYQSEVAPE
jgi:hypothetical protein